MCPEKYGRIVYERFLLSYRDTEILLRDEIIRQCEIKYRDVEILRRDEIIRQLDIEIKQRDAEILRLGMEHKECLNSIYSSRTWKLALLFRKIYRIVFSVRK